MRTAVLFTVAAALLTACSSTGARRMPATTPAAAASGKAKNVSNGKSVVATDDLEMYAVVSAVPDPLEPLNRGTFWVNHQLYHYALRPVSDGYELIVPEKGREAISNAYENISFPIRFVNDLLQWKLERAGKEAGAFVVNSTVGVAGLGRPSRHIPALADIPRADTAQTFAKWGLPNGFYFVIPVLGPTTLRDGVGRAGDWALNPITWAGFVTGNPAWFIAVPAGNTLRSLPAQLDVYDAATEGSLDRYLASRSAYLAYRKDFNSR